MRFPYLDFFLFAATTSDKKKKGWRSKRRVGGGSTSTSASSTAGASSSNLEPDSRSVTISKYNHFEPFCYIDYINMTYLFYACQN